MMQDRSHTGNTAAFEKQLQQIQQAQLPATPAACDPATGGRCRTNNLLSVPLTARTNTPATDGSGEITR